jgi:deazaflavin-dependent oxidoreductase (nitroreductase family)
MKVQGRRLSWESLAGSLNVFAAHAALYRLLRGRLVGRNILLLTTIGCRTGLQRCTPLYYARDAADYVIVASNGGDVWYPGWWHNIRSDPHVTIQAGARIEECLATEVSAGEAETLWPHLLAVYPGYSRYRERTSRPLTLFRLRPTSAAGAGVRKQEGRSRWTG